MIRTDSISNLAAALVAAQAELENATKSAENPHFRSRYADLAEVRDTVIPVFSKHGLSVVQLPSFLEGIVTVETILLHASGEYLAGECSAPVSKADAQGVGSAITYCRRYALAALACIGQEDDDGEAAVRGKAKGTKAPDQAPRQVQAKAADFVRAAFLRAQTEADFAAALAEAKKLGPTERQAVQPAYESTRTRLGLDTGAAAK